MKENDNKNASDIEKLPDVSVLELEKMLKRHGMKKSQFCEMFGKTRSWFYSVLRVKKQVPLYILHAFVLRIGRDMFDELYEAVK